MVFRSIVALLPWMVALGAGRLAAQVVVPPDSSAARPAVSPSSRPADSASAAGPDSVPGKATDPASPARPSDTVPATRGYAPPTGPASPPPPADSVVAAACAHGARLAPDLLVVLFTPSATAAERLALADSVGGVLLGPAETIEAGGWYLQAPAADQDPTIADRLIRFAAVREVAPIPCPVR